MKFKGLIIVLGLLMVSPQMQGQFLKKLQKKLEKVTEEVIINKTSQKAGETVDKTMDKAFDNILGLGGDKSSKDGISNAFEMGDASDVPDTYHFQWKYTMEMTDKKENTTTIAYLLEPDEKYLGMAISTKKKSEDMLMVLDKDRNINVMFMNSKKEKIGMVTKMDMDMSDLELEDDTPLDFDFVEIPDKVILGKSCKGFKMENDEAVTIMYNDMDAPVSISNIFGVNTKLAPKGFNPKWLDHAEDSMMMEMSYTNKKNGNSILMRCVDIAEEELKINKSDYQFSSFGMVGK